MHYARVLPCDSLLSLTAFFSRCLAFCLHVRMRQSIVARAGKLGLGTAYRDGLLRCTGDFVFLMDADFSHHPRAIPAFLAEQARG
jgi:glycosyltransferase involved in cell wall biosynthesis